MLFPKAENEIKWLPNDRSLPMKSIHKGSVGAGIFLLIFGILWTGFIIMFASLFASSRGFMAWSVFWIFLFSLPFFAIGIVVIIFGLYQFFYREEIEIFPDAVQLHKQGFRKKLQWREPLSNYRGILKEIHEYRDSTDYSIVLLHHDPEKEVILFESRVAGNLEQRIENFAKLFRLPILKEVGKDFAAIAVEDAHKTLKEKVAEGYFAQDLESGALQLSKRAKIEKKNDGVSVYYLRLWSCPRQIFAVLIAVGLWYMAWRFNSAHPHDPVPAVIIGFFGFFAALFVLFFLLSLVSMEGLFISASAIEYRIRYPWGWGKAKSIPTDDIKDIIVLESHGFSLPNPLQIVGKDNPLVLEWGKESPGQEKKFPSLSDIGKVIKSQQLIVFGSYLTLEDKLALRKYIISFLAKTK